MRRPSPPTPARPDLDRLVAEARLRPPMTPGEKREQAISFAYGNSAIDNPRITREMVAKAYDELTPPQIVRDPDMAAVLAEMQRATALIESAVRLLRRRVE